MTFKKGCLLNEPQNSRRIALTHDKFNLKLKKNQRSWLLTTHERANKHTHTHSLGSLVGKEKSAAHNSWVRKCTHMH